MLVCACSRIPGIQTQLKPLAKLPDQLALLWSKEGEGDGMMGLVRRASHLFNLVMGKVVGSNGYRVACRYGVHHFLRCANDLLHTQYC